MYSYIFSSVVFDIFELLNCAFLSFSPNIHNWLPKLKRKLKFLLSQATVVNRLQINNNNKKSVTCIHFTFKSCILLFSLDVSLTNTSFSLRHDPKGVQMPLLYTETPCKKCEMQFKLHLINKYRKQTITSRKLSTKISIIFRNFLLSSI